LFKKSKELKFIQYIPKHLDLKYFKLTEFDSPDEVGSGYKMDKEFLIKLDYARGIGYYGSRERYLILHALIQVGITRFGIAKGFIHCDVDKAKDPDVIWLY
jgi:hypothetical protein